VTGNAGRFAGRRYVPGAVAAAASGCLMALLAAGTATASTAGQSVINASLNDVSCTSASNCSPSACMAVGDFAGIGNELTLAESWNGTAWTVVKTPHP
jgi:hypothetical protein